MARLARVVAVDVAHHVTQRGNRREYILSTDAERMVYLDLLRQAVQLYPLSIIGYCLMSNHVHLITIPHESDALALALSGPTANTPHTGMLLMPSRLQGLKACSRPCYCPRNGADEWARQRAS